MEDLNKIRVAAANGLTKQETSALVGHALTSEELVEFNKTKAYLKLKQRKDQEDEIE